MALEVLEELLQPLPLRNAPERDRVPSFLEIGHGYRPGRSSGLSVLFHLFALLLIVVSSTRFAYVHAAEVVHPGFQPMKIDPLFLPVFGGGSQGAGVEGGERGGDRGGRCLHEPVLAARRLLGQAGNGHLLAHIAWRIVSLRGWSGGAPAVV